MGDIPGGGGQEGGANPGAGQWEPAQAPTGRRPAGRDWPAGPVGEMAPPKWGRNGDPKQGPTPYLGKTREGKKASGDRRRSSVTATWRAAQLGACTRTEYSVHITASAIISS